MVLHAQVAESLEQGTDTFIMTDGDVLELDERGASFGERIEADYVYVDGLGVGDIDHVVLRDRKHLASDGMVVVILADGQADGPRRRDGLRSCRAASSTWTRARS